MHLGRTYWQKQVAIHLQPMTMVARYQKRIGLDKCKQYACQILGLSTKLALEQVCKKEKGKY